MAMIALIAGIASWVIAPVVGSIVAIVCGHMARKQIRETGEDGDQQAVIGLVLGYVHLGVTCLTCGVVVVIYGGIIAAVIGLGETGQLH